MRRGARPSPSPMPTNFPHFITAASRHLLAVLAVLLIGTALPAHAVTTQLIAGGFSAPIDIVHAGDGSGRLFIAEQGGSIWILQGATRPGTPFLDIAALVVSGGERGLLGVAFHPGY